MPILPLLVGARWVHFAALFVLFGAPLVWLFLGHGARQLLPHALRATELLLAVAALIAALSGLLWLAALLANMVGGFAALDTAALHAFFFETRFGPIVLARLILLAAVVLAIFLRGLARLIAWLALAAGLLVDQAWLGHAGDGGSTLLGAAMIATYVVHVLAAGAWVGGLPALFFALFTPRDAAKDWESRASLLAHYADMATLAVTLILLSGIANMLFRADGHLAKLFATIYGEVLAVKLGLVALMLILASFNRFVALPRMRAAAAWNGGTLRASIGVELGLGLAVIAAAALLGVTPPPG